MEDLVSCRSRISSYDIKSKLLRYSTITKAPGHDSKVAVDELEPIVESRELDDRSLGLLDSDQLLAILRYLPIQTVISFGMTCRRYRTLAETDALWFHMCEREWGSRAVEAWPSLGRHKVGWKLLYRQMSVLGGAAWHRMHQADPIPGPRASHVMSFVNGKIIVFGGGCSGGRHLDDTWVATVPEELPDGLVWEQSCIGTPNGRFGQSYTVVGDMLVVFGGINDKGLRMNDTWISGGAFLAERSFWQKLVLESSPSPRGAHSGCYAGDSKVVIFGGIGSSGERLGDTWILDIAETPCCWKEVITPLSPCARSGHTLTWIGGKQMILFGGRGVDFEVKNDVWMLDMEGDHPSWVEIRACGLHPIRDYPSARSGHSATLIYGGRILIYAGEDSKRTSKGDIWVMDPSAGFHVNHNTTCAGTYLKNRSCCTSNRSSRKLWKKLKQWGRPPCKRSFHGACAVQSGRVILIFGGMVDGEPIRAPSARLGFDAELHMLQLVS